MADQIGIAYVETGRAQVVAGMRVFAAETAKTGTSLDRLVRESAKAQNEIQRLASAMRAGSITGGQYTGEMNKISARLNRMGMDRAQSEVMRYGRATAQATATSQGYVQALTAQNVALRTSADAHHFASGRMNATGMAVQQVGYQVGDFFVQIQSGTNAFVAFGQQATQLVGILPMFSAQLGMSVARLIAISTGLGIAIPLLTAIGAAFMRTRDGMKDTESAADSLEERVKSLNRTLAEYEQARRAIAAGLTPEQLVSAENLDAAKAELTAAREALAELQAAIISFPSGVGPGGEGGAFLGRFLIKGTREINTTIDEATKRLREAEALVARLNDRLTEEQSEAYSEAITPLRQQVELLDIQRQYGEDSIQYRAKEAEQARANYAAEMAALVASGEQTQLQADIRTFLNSKIVEGNLLLENQAALQEAGNTALDVAASLWEGIAERVRETFSAHQATVAAAEERIAQLEQEAILNEAIAMYGEDSAQVEAIRRAQAMAAVEAYIQQNNLADELAQRLREAAARAYDASVAAGGVANNLGAAAAQAVALANVLSSISGLTAAVNQRVIGLRAAIAAAQEGADQYAQTAASTLAIERAKLAVQLSSSDMGERMAAQQGLNDLNTALQTETDLLREQAEIRDSMNRSDDGGGGGGGAARELVTLESVVATLRERLDVELKLAQLHGGARREAQIMMDLQKQLGEDAARYSEEQLRQAAQTIIALEDQIKAANDFSRQMEEIADGIGDAFGDFMRSGFTDFKGFTDGIVDMFADMLTEMVAQSAAAELKFALGVGEKPTNSIFRNMGNLLQGFGGRASTASAGVNVAGAASTGASVAGALGGLGGALSALAGPLGIVVGLFGIFGQRARARREQEKKIEKERESLEMRKMELLGQDKKLQEKRLEQYHESNRALAKEIMALEKKKAIEEEATDLDLRLAAVRGKYMEVFKAELQTVDKANRAKYKEVLIAEERLPLEMQLLQLQGNTAAIRKMELRTLHPANRELQKRIWALEDEAAIQQEREGLDTRLLQLQGNTAKLREIELAQLDKSNQARQLEIWRLEDAAAIQQEREGLERRLLELQGNTAELRRRELEALDPANRAMQEQIWALEDMKEALDALDMNDFVSLIDYNRAVARANAGIANMNSAPQPPSSIASVPAPTSTSSTPNTVSPGNGNSIGAMTDQQVRDAVQNLTNITQQLLTRIDNNTRRTENILREWDETGLPEERVA